MMNSTSINTLINKIWPAQHSIQWRSVKSFPEKHMFRHSEIILFWPWQYPTERTMGEPPAPSMYIYICSTYLWSSHHIYVNLTDPVKLLTVAAGIWASGSSSSWIIAFIGGFEEWNLSLWSFENLGLADPAFLEAAVKYLFLSKTIS